MSKSQQDVAAELIALKAQQEKIYGEVSGKLQELAQAIANQGAVSPAVEAALADLTAAVQGTDDLIVDQP